MHKRYSGIRGERTYANQQTDIAKDCTDIELNGNYLEIVEKFYYLGGTLREL